MNGHCCRSPYSLLKWPALLALALMLCHSTSRPVLAAAPNAKASTAMKRTVQQGPVTLDLELDRTEVLVAEPLRLKMTARAPQGVKVRFPETDGRLGDFEITVLEDVFDVPVGAERTWQRVLKLESFTSGSKELPPITLAYTDERAASANDSAGTINTPALPIMVTSEVEANVNPTRFRDIKGVAELTIPEAKSHGWVIGTAAGTLVLGLAGLWLIVGRRRLQSPAQWALGELDRLESSGLGAAGDFDNYFCGVTDILRGYIERQFAIRAPHLTTREFLARVEVPGVFDSDQRRLLAAFLELSDVVKFARFDVNDHDAERAVVHCRRFIQSTSTSTFTHPTTEQPAQHQEHQMAAASA